MVLVRLDEGVQKLVYYKNKALLPAEMRYSTAEQMALALVTAVRTLRPYFQAHRIEVHTDCPLKQILSKLEVLGRLTKWVVELSEFDISYFPKAAIKGQAVADLISEFNEPNSKVIIMLEDK
ncbi:hypothetical protein Dsin_005663 [Dipteronia sinensis]|uniref:Reverse transcriptase RNase H-like domain-containing protein n=1 Tax=Dipteronia sinensis TaxID=43782 RepID=A0AAE0EEX2_9ROSI|nr:hypothetical protein Dsin_005663 [Dipteronia sinensis]